MSSSIRVQSTHYVHARKRNFTLSWSSDPWQTMLVQECSKLLRIKSWAVHGMAGCRQLFPCGTLDERRNQVAILNFCKRKGQLHRIIRVGKRGCGTVHMLLASLTQLRMLI
jgi:hypothetical protein